MKKNTAKPLITAIPQTDLIHNNKESMINPIRILSAIMELLCDFAEAINSAPTTAGPNNPPAATMAFPRDGDK